LNTTSSFCCWVVASPVLTFKDGIKSLRRRLLACSIKSLMQASSFLLTDDDKGNDADGDRNMRDANPARNPQGGHKEVSFANPQSSAPRAGNLTDRLL
jgi:hypothetical protein